MTIPLILELMYLNCLLFSDSDYSKQLSEYVYSLFTWAEATTFYQSYTFAINCETETHTLECICDQSEYVIKEYKKLKEKFTNKASFCKLLNLPVISALHTTHYKDWL